MGEDRTEKQWHFDYIKRMIRNSRKRKGAREFFLAQEYFYELTCTLVLLEYVNH